MGELNRKTKRQTETGRKRTADRETRIETMGKTDRNTEKDANTR